MFYAQSKMDFNKSSVTSIFLLAMVSAPHTALKEPPAPCDDFLKSVLRFQHSLSTEKTGQLRQKFYF